MDEKRNRQLPPRSQVQYSRVVRGGEESVGSTKQTAGESMCATIALIDAKGMGGGENRVRRR